MKHKVFICYGREDGAAANRVYQDLTTAGHRTWLDSQSLIPGQKWQPAIMNAIRNSRYFVALLSSRSVNRKGFVNKEIREALDVLAEFPEDHHFLIPVRLDECTPSDPRLRELQRVDMFPSWEEGIRQIKKALEIAPSPDAAEQIDWSRQLAYALVNSTGGIDAAQRQIAQIPCVRSIRVLFGDADFLVTLQGPINELSAALKQIGDLGNGFKVRAYLTGDQSWVDDD